MSRNTLGAGPVTLVLWEYRDLAIESRERTAGGVVLRTAAEAASCQELRRRALRRAV
jgi:hypothetical protein